MNYHFQYLSSEAASYHVTFVLSTQMTSRQLKIFAEKSSGMSKLKNVRRDIQHGDIQHNDN
jgi:hypothetical protein